MHDNFPEDGLVRLPQITRFLNIGRSTWLNGVRIGRFPQPVRLGGITAWRAKDVRALLADRHKS